MKKTKSFLSIFFVFVFFGTFISSNLFTPAKVSALSQNELAARAHTILKLEALKRCSNAELNWQGIEKDKGPFNLKFLPGPFGDFDTLDMPVGYGVEKNNGQWDCASQNGDRENQWFKLILRNDSKDKYYSGWSSGDYKYKGYDSKNLKDTKGDGKLYFINPDNAANFNLAGSKALDSASKAHTKINKQIDKSIERQEDGLDNKEKSAMLYASLADTFFNDNACDSSKVDQNDSGRKIKIGDTWYSLPGDDFATGDQEVFSVGYGKYGWDNTGKATCEAIAKKMDRHRADYISVTGDKGDVPKGTTSGTAGDPASTTNDVQSE